MPVRKQEAEAVTPETVVFIHGLWMTGLELFRLRHRAKRAGYHTERFSYRTVSGSLDDNAEALHDFLAGLPDGRTHLVAHSLGGLLCLRLFERYGPPVTGRLVFLGSPVRGSQAARATASHRLGEVMLGQSARDGLIPAGEPEWCWPNQLGVLAGIKSAGMVSFMGQLPAPNDGTVVLEETRIAGAADRIELPVTHMGMVFSRAVADQVIHFLRNGSFG